MVCQVYFCSSSVESRVLRNVVQSALLETYIRSQMAEDLALTVTMSPAT